MREKSAWSEVLTFQDREGTIGTWVEDVSMPGHPWGLGCKVCRWGGMVSTFAAGEVRSRYAITLRALRLHGNHTPAKTSKGRVVRRCAKHEMALANISRSPAGARALVSGIIGAPSLGQLYTAYKCEKAGANLCSYTKDLNVSRASGASIPQCRSSREIANT